MTAPAARLAMIRLTSGIQSWAFGSRDPWRSRSKRTVAPHPGWRRLSLQSAAMIRLASGVQSWASGREILGDRAGNVPLRLTQDGEGYRSRVSAGFALERGINLGRAQGQVFRSPTPDRASAPGGAAADPRRAHRAGSPSFRPHPPAIQFNEHLEGEGAAIRLRPAGVGRHARDQDSPSRNLQP